MARIRTIKPEFFRHEELYQAEQEEGLPLRVAFAGLWTACDKAGRFRWQPRQLKLDCLPFDDVDFSRVLDALWSRGFLVKYEVDGRQFGFVPSWDRHQFVNNKERASDLPEPNENNILTRGERVNVACETRGDKEREGESKGKGTDSRSRPVTRLTDEEFEKFKRAYPRRKGSQPWQPARKKLDTLIANGVTTLDEVVSALQRFIGFDPDKRDTEFIPQAVKWLNDHRWRDLPVPVMCMVPINPGEQEVDFFRRVGRWNAAYGPEPGQSGCRVPPEILEKYGYRNAA